MTISWTWIYFKGLITRDCFCKECKFAQTYWISSY